MRLGRLRLHLKQVALARSAAAGFVDQFPLGQAFGGGARRWLGRWHYLGRFFSPQHQYVADLLHGRTIQGCTDLLDECIAIIAFDAVKLDLDQLVGFEGEINFLQHGFGKTVVADADNGMKMVGRRAQFAAPGSFKFSHGRIVT